MSRTSYAVLACIFALVAFLGYQAGQPRTLVTEAEGDTALLQGIATNESAQVTALAPTATRYVTSTPTRTPKPATETPRATYGAASPVAGIYLVPAWTETPANKGTVEPETLPPCVTVTPEQYSDTYCEVGA